MESCFQSVFVLLASIGCVCRCLEGVCVGEGGCKCAEISRKQEKSCVPICGCFRCTFSIRSSRDARRRAAGGRDRPALPHKRAGRRVNKAVTVTGWSPLKWSADSWKRPRLRAGLGLRGVKLMKYLVLLHVKHAGGFWPNYCRQSAVRGGFSPHRPEQVVYLL